MAACLRKTAVIHVSVLLLIFTIHFSDNDFLQGVACLGINYGQVGNNLLPPERVIDLLSAVKLRKVRIYDTNPQVLAAFAGSDVDLIVTVENEMLGPLTDPQQALQWLNAHVKPYFPRTRIAGIHVGNEILDADSPDPALVANLVPAMISLHAALSQLGLDRYIQVSTPMSLGVLAESYPTSAGRFKLEVADIMSQFLQFLASTGSPFWINAYPYFAYKDDPSRVSLDYVLANPNKGMVDPYTNLRYDNMLYAQVDAVVFAMARMGFQGIEVRVSETGWPSKGDPNEVGATVQNAAIYNRNLLRRQLENEGTPLRPNTRLEVYVFALFNEDMKPGPTSERNYGLFQPDGTMAYNVGLAGLSTSSDKSDPSTSISLTSSADKVTIKSP
ncbi:hypothetical protein SAY87_004704 [Trapa incisa]|uniref:glucan endo-1,3-beta-D-glucosidase n=1 Tax=Trapa incisa TaxID=236973 RepID=A0AAN7JQ35_9MYRT|nr:hypothetical protein SAY87_004704 [Trapa incisa]